MVVRYSEDSKNAAKQVAEEPSADRLEAMGVDEIRALVHDLHVHKIELEMQNEELRDTQATLEREKERYALLYDCAPSGYCTLTEYGIVLQCNQSLCHQLKVEPQRLLRYPLAKYLDDSGLPAFYNALKRPEERLSLQLRFIRGDREPMYGLLQLQRMQSESDATPAPWLVTISDVTRNHQLDLELRRSEGLLRQMAANFPQSYVITMDRTLRIGLAEGQAFAQRGLDPGRYFGLELEELLEDVAHELEGRAQAVFEGRKQEFEVRNDDETLFCRAIPLRGDKGRVEQLLLVVEDISERKRNELEKDTLASIAALFLHSSSLGEIFQQIAEILSRNMGYPCVALEQFDSARDEMVYLAAYGLHEIKPPLRVPTAETPSGSVARNARPLVARQCCERPDDRAGVLRRHGIRTFVCVPILLDGKVFGTLSLGDWMTRKATGSFCSMLEGIAAQLAQEISRNRLQKAMQESEKRFRLLANSLPNFVWTAEPDGRCDFLNEQWLAYAGVAEGAQLGFRWMQQVHPDDRDGVVERWNEAVSGGAAFHTELRIRSHEGSYRWFDARAVPIKNDQGKVLKWFGSHNDIEGQRRAEEALRRAQKMEAIGEITGGIAHDFNNILGIILGNIDSLTLRPDLDEGMRKHLEAIERSAERAASLTQQLLGFSRRQPARMTATDLAALLQGMQQLVARSVTPQIDVVYRLDAEAWPTEIDPGDFEDALINLVLNSRDAMPEGGRIEIRLGNRVIDERFCEAHPDATLGDHVAVTVTDTGRGIPAEQLGRIFEPFFTTKEKGKGTGLGLAMVYGFVQRSGGYIRAESAAESGTRIEILLPRTERPLPAVAEVVNEGRRDAAPSGSAHILVVDDEEGLVDLAREALQGLGYQVSTAFDGRAAVARLQENDAIDLLFTDVVMPGMNGYELLERARELRPKLKVLLTSGYASTAASEVLSEENRKGLRLLPKPYTRQELAQQVQQVLLG